MSHGRYPLLVGMARKTEGRALPLLLELLPLVSFFEANQQEDLEHEPVLAVLAVF